MSDTATADARKGWGPLAIAGGFAALLVAAAGALWAYYGTAVFYEIILAGIAMCL